MPLGTEKVRVAIHGAGGRMGKRLLALGMDDPLLALCAAIEQPGHPELGRDIGELVGREPLGVPLTDRLQADADVVIDFSTPDGAAAILDVCLQQRISLVLATTGMTAHQQQTVEHAASSLPIVWAPNMSLAVNLTMKLASVAAQSLANYGPGADVEIIERHHRFKQDAPSGTALRFGELIAAQMGQTRHIHGRHGITGERPQSEIGYHALRTGDNPGEHTIVFGLMGETIELTVRATNRDSYALGALVAAKFVYRQPPGLYTMVDVLGLR